MQVPQGLTLSEKDSFAEQEFDAFNSEQQEGALHASNHSAKASGVFIIAVWLVGLVFCALVFSGLGFLLVAFDATFIGGPYQLPESSILRAVVFSVIGLGHALPCGAAVWMGYLMSCGFIEPHKRSAEF